MDNSIITPKLKDQLLIDLLSVESMDVQNNIYTCAKEFNIDPGIVTAIYDQFEELGLVNQTKCMGGIVFFKIKAKAHDMYRNGGFEAQEEILKANIQKLSYELDLLSKQLAPDFLEKTVSISTIGSAILSSLALFKS